MAKKYPSELMLTDYPEVLNVNQVSEILHVSRKHVYKMIDHGELRAVKAGNGYRFPKLKLIEYLLGEQDIK